MLGRVRGWRVLTAVLGVALSATLVSCTSDQSNNGFARLPGAQLRGVRSLVGLGADTIRGCPAGVYCAHWSVGDLPLRRAQRASRARRAVRGRRPARRSAPSTAGPAQALRRRTAVGATGQRNERRGSARLLRRSGSRSHPPTERLYGVWFKAANKSLVWYDVAAFERAGLAPPDELTGLPATEQALRALGVTAFSVGGGDQWTLTDWFENLYLQLAGPHDYDLLAAHHLPWTDPSVQATLLRMTELLAPQFMRGGVAGALGTGFEDSVARAFGTPPGAAMVAEGDFVAGRHRGADRARIGIGRRRRAVSPCEPCGSGRRRRRRRSGAAALLAGGR